MPTKELPQSFTQFRKKVEYAQDLLKAETNLEITETPRSLSPLPAAMINESKYALQLPSVDKPNPNDEKDKPKYQGGESAALNHLKSYFASNAPSSYKTTRNALDEWTHSTKFSAWLANGTLSVKVLLNRLRQYEREVVANGSTYWIWFELLWREYFYWYAIEHQEDLFLFKGIGDYRPSTRHDDQRLAQWQNGETKYPIINACMCQLNHTGYMSNRGRQLVASCFIHELGLDWRYGAAYFEQQLIDYDVGSNWGNWQYLAGVGADPRGSRQFNLKKQTQQHDPNGEFMDKWLS
jgi:deoxyribodipyrimidine photo-lyase